MSKKGWAALAAAVLVVLASLSCTALTGAGGEPVPGLAGRWQDTDTTTVHTIEWQPGSGFGRAGTYVVTSCANPGEESFPITAVHWDSKAGVLTWTYHVTSTGVDVTFETVAVNGDVLQTTWRGTVGEGSEALVRVP